MSTLSIFLFRAQENLSRLMQLGSKRVLLCKPGHCVDKTWKFFGHCLLASCCQNISYGLAQQVLILLGFVTTEAIARQMLFCINNSGSHCFKKYCNKKLKIAKIVKNCYEIIIRNENWAGVVFWDIKSPCIYSLYMEPRLILKVCVSIRKLTVV